MNAILDTMTTRLTQRAELPDVRLHADAVVRMLLKKGQPELHRFWVAVANLNQSSKGDSLKVLLRLLEDEVAPRHGPPLSDARQRNWTKRREFEIVRRSKGKVGEELEVPHAEGSQLKVARGNAVFGLPPQWLQVECLDAARESNILCRVARGGCLLVAGSRRWRSVARSRFGCGRQESTRDVGLLGLMSRDVSLVDQRRQGMRNRFSIHKGQRNALLAAARRTRA